MTPPVQALVYLLMSVCCDTANASVGVFAGVSAERKQGKLVNFDPFQMMFSTMKILTRNCWS